MDTQRKHTVTIPAAYVEAFRAGSVWEVNYDSARASEDEPGDISSRLRLLRQTLELAEQLVPGHDPREDLGVSSDAATLSFTCQATARRVLVPRLVEELDRDFEGGDPNRLLWMIESLRWTITTAHEMLAADVAERSAVR